MSPTSCVCIANHCSENATSKSSVATEWCCDCCHSSKRSSSATHFWGSSQTPTRSHSGSGTGEWEPGRGTGTRRPPGGKVKLLTGEEVAGREVAKSRKCGQCEKPSAKVVRNLPTYVLCVVMCVVMCVCPSCDNHNMQCGSLYYCAAKIFVDRQPRKFWHYATTRMQ